MIFVWGEVLRFEKFWYVFSLWLLELRKLLLLLFFYEQSEIILNIYMVCVHSLQSLSYGERVYSEIKSTIALFLYLDSNQISLLVTIKLSLSFIDYNNFIDIYKYIFIEMNFLFFIFIFIFIGRLIKRRKMKHVIITGAYEWERYP